uniref:hypothetical protein n=1 Tax=Serratia proteamaculans TaxID=28151 RepID=UPI001F4BD9F3|nr:hypothetical protein [Serratia proteamaculans]ULG13680.1 hypothetical protein 4p_00099 [Serratia proteamaculans]ULG15131.1 hypothetical protein 163p1_00040 [Serratia proteamaculans]ULG16367.1 hypothetical protein 1129p_00004 [Serratia proteamaculans]ULG19440.1 hypothetical protein SpFp1_00016 [Serratia proteamaculans]
MRGGVDGATASAVGSSTGAGVLALHLVQVPLLTKRMAKDVCCFTASASIEIHGPTLVRFRPQNNRTCIDVYNMHILITMITIMLIESFFRSLLFF